MSTRRVQFSKLRFSSSTPGVYIQQFSIPASWPSERKFKALRKKTLFYVGRGCSLFLLCYVITYNTVLGANPEYRVLKGLCWKESVSTNKAYNLSFALSPAHFEPLGPVGAAWARFKTWWRRTSTYWCLMMK